jgi:hypothetical protein
MSQTTDFETRIGVLNAAVDVMDEYVSKHPDDWDLKLDLVRLLTRLANLEQYKDRGSAEKRYQRASELVGQAANAPDSKLERSNWLKASIDKELYEGDFLFEIKGDSPSASKNNQRAFDLAASLSGIEGQSAALNVIRARLHAQKSSILQVQDRLDESLVEATLGVDQVAKVFPSGMLTTGLSVEQIERIDYGDILIYLTSLSQRCSVLKKLERRDDYKKSLRQLLSCAEIAKEISTAQRDARMFGIMALRELHRISLSEGQDSQASRWYEETSEWIEQAGGDPSVLEEALVLESDRAMLLAARDLVQAKESLLRAASYLEALKPQEEHQDDYNWMRYLDDQIVYNDSKLAVLLAQGDLPEHQKLRDKQTELVQTRGLLDAKISGKERKE